MDVRTRAVHRSGRGRKGGGPRRSNAGGVLPLFVVVLVALLGMMALAVDFGFALTAPSREAFGLRHHA